MAMAIKLDHQIQLTAEEIGEIRPTGIWRLNFAPSWQRERCSHSARSAGVARRLRSRAREVLRCFHWGMHLLLPTPSPSRKREGRIMGNPPRLPGPRSAERRVGKESVSTCRARWEPYH